MMWIFELSIVEVVFEEFVKEYDIEIYWEEWLDWVEGVVMDGKNISIIIILSG